MSISDDILSYNITEEKKQIVNNASILTYNRLQSM